VIKINRSKALILLSMVSFAALCGSLYIVGNSTAYANSTSGNSTPLGFMRGMLGQWFGFGGGRMNLTQTPGGFMQGFGEGQMRVGCGPYGSVQVSAEYNQTVINIVKSDSDAANLLAQGYSIQSVRPIITSVVQADGTVTMSATKAVVMLTQSSTTSGTTTVTGWATVYVDVANAKVTQIVITTRTTIQK
jgi:hypothetical protein